MTRPSGNSLIQFLKGLFTSITKYWLLLSMLYNTSLSLPYTHSFYLPFLHPLSLVTTSLFSLSI